MFVVSSCQDGDNQIVGVYEYIEEAIEAVSVTSFKFGRNFGKNGRVDDVPDEIVISEWNGDKWRGDFSASMMSIAERAKFAAEAKAKE